jgi:hypothetical protein
MDLTKFKQYGSKCINYSNFRRRFEEVKDSPELRQMMGVDSFPYMPADYYQNAGDAELKLGLEALIEDFGTKLVRETTPEIRRYIIETKSKEDPEMALSAISEKTDPLKLPSDEYKKASEHHKKIREVYGILYSEDKERLRGSLNDHVPKHWLESVNRLISSDPDELTKIYARIQSAYFQDFSSEFIEDGGYKTEKVRTYMDKVLKQIEDPKREAIALASIHLRRRQKRS